MDQRAFSTAMLAFVFCVVQSLCFSAMAAADKQWEWTSDALPNQKFKTWHAALSATKSLGGKFALAEVVESPLVVHENDNVTEYVVGAKSSGPNVPPTWRNYQIQHGHPDGNLYTTEEDAVRSVLNNPSFYYSECPQNQTARRLLPLADWGNGAQFYSGDEYNQSRLYNFEYFGDYIQCTKKSVLVQGSRERTVECPIYTTWHSVEKACVLHRIVTIKKSPLVCEVKSGNPCGVSSGDKSLSENDFSLPWLKFSRNYHTAGFTPYGGFGAGWSHSLNVQLSINGSGVAAGLLDSAGIQVPLRTISYYYFEPTTGGNYRIRYESGNFYLRTADGDIQTFDGSGTLLRHDMVNGEVLIYQYDATRRLIAVGHSSGKAVGIVYMSGYQVGASGRISAIISNGQNLVTYNYNVHGNLEKVIRADGSERHYHYEFPALPSHITGITDENGGRYAYYQYDDYGRATLSEHAGGAGRVTLAYNETNTVVTSPLGRTTTYNFTTDGYSRKVTSTTDGETTSSSNYASYSSDFRRRPTLTTAENGTQTAYTYSDAFDSALGVTVRTERRTEAPNTPQQRIYETRKNVETGWLYYDAMPGKVVQQTFDARGNVLTRAETDAASSQTRTWTHSYCTADDGATRRDGCKWLGQRKATDGPRTDASDITRFEYADNGELYRTINALGQATTIAERDAYGHPSRIIDANGIETRLEYDNRQRLVTRTVAGAVTRNAYDAVGQLTSTIAPDGSTSHYEYDDAHRLVEVRDHSGNRIRYTLDAAGNRTREETFNHLNQSVRLLTRNYDNKGRLTAENGGNGQSTSYGYNSANQKVSENPLGTPPTQFQYDGLGRLARTVDAIGGSTQQGYDALDNLVSVTDAKGLTTRYTVNAFGETTRLESPDTGITTSSYDPAGNLAQQTNGRGASPRYRYDALNRLTQKSAGWGSGDEDINYFYDGSNYAGGGIAHGIGRLTGFSDSSGRTEYRYDARGNLIEVRTVFARYPSQTWVVRYGFDAADRRVQMTYPSGRVITWQRDAQGRVQAIQSELNGQTQALSQNLNYLPFGSPKSWQHGNGLATAQQFDTSYRLTSVSNPAYSRNYSYYPTDLIADLNNPLNSAENQHLWYDNLHRLVYAQGAYGTQNYALDAIGNRAYQWLNPRTAENSQQYITPYYNHRLETLQHGNHSTSYHYDHNGLLSGKATRSNPGNVLTQQSGYGYNSHDRLVIFHKQLAAANNPQITGPEDDLNAPAPSSYRYGVNALGQRVSKERYPNGEPWANAQAARGFLYDPSGQLIAEVNPLTGVIQAETIWLDHTPISHYTRPVPTPLAQQGNMIAPANGLQAYYIHSDHLNTPQVLTDGSGQVAWQASYDPYGNPIRITGNGRDAGTNLPNNLASIVFNLRFPGQYYDAESGLYQNWNRDYDPSIGRYIQSDPIGLGGGMNTYSYVGNNPLSHIDPTGELLALPAIIPYIPAILQTITTIAIATPIAAAIVEMCDKPCPPCKTVSGRIVPVGTIGYRLDVVPPSRPHYPFSGSHVHLSRANQNPKNCQCFWQEIDVQLPPPPPGAMPIEYFAN